jgi:hypothetical protein
MANMSDNGSPAKFDDDGLHPQGAAGDVLRKHVFSNHQSPP